MSQEQAAREAKHTILLRECSELRKEVERLEEFLDKLKGTQRPPSVIGIKQAEMPSFLEVYSSVAVNIREIKDRFLKARQELEEMLL